MQSSLKAASQAARTSYVLLCLSLLISLFAPAATNVARGSQDGGPVLLSLRAARQHQQDTEVPVTTTDVGKALVREAQDIAWKAGGAASKTRAGVSKLRSKINELVAGEHAKEAEKMGNEGTGVYLPQATQSEAAAKASLEQALANEAEVKKVLASVDAKAYKAAQAAAVKEVGKLDAEAKKYFASLLAKFKALALPGPPTAADAAAKAAQPYIDVELRVGALVQYYNEKALTNIAEAQTTTFTAQQIATTAQAEQAAGVVDMAQRHMIQAHMLVGAANLKKQEAYKIRKLAESLNMSIPSYQRAAQMAAIHALATFAGLQVGDKAHIEMRQKIKESTQQVDKAFEKLDSTMAETLKALEAIKFD